MNNDSIIKIPKEKTVNLMNLFFEIKNRTVKKLKLSNNIAIAKLAFNITKGINKRFRKVRNEINLCFTFR